MGLPVFDLLALSLRQRPMIGSAGSGLTDGSFSFQGLEERETALPHQLTRIIEHE
jgi:hypothetical protein